MTLRTYYSAEVCGMLDSLEIGAQLGHHPVSSRETWAWVRRSSTAIVLLDAARRRDRAPDLPGNG